MPSRRLWGGVVVFTILLIACVIIGFRVYSQAPWFLPIASCAMAGITFGLLIRIFRMRRRDKSS